MEDIDNIIKKIEEYKCIIDKNYKTNNDLIILYKNLMNNVINEFHLLSIKLYDAERTVL